MTAVASRQDRTVDPPDNRDLGVVPGNPSLELRIVEVAALVQELGRLRQNQKAMSEAGRDVDLPAVLSREHRPLVTTKSSRAPAYVQNYVEHFALNDAATRSLRMSNLIVQSPEHTFLGTRVIILNKPIGDPQLKERPLVVALKEEASRVPARV